MTESRSTPLELAKAQLDELIEAARRGAIVPARLASQLEAVRSALDQVRQPEETALAADYAELLKEQAYFVSHAVHELRTPMTSIRGYADMLASGAMGAVSDMQKQFIETIRANAKRMESLLTDVSDTAKIRGGTLRVQPKMDMFKNIAMNVEKQMRPVAESLNRSLVIDVPQGLPILNVDGELLVKALCKLIENGLRYSGENGEVRLSASADGSRLLIKVQDNGIGMTPAEISQLGTIFFRSDNEVVRAHKGSGLGIPVVFGIIRLLNGTIEVQSEVGKGTTFTIGLMGMS
jgi:signal transduction histidine kinase